MTPNKKEALYTLISSVSFFVFLLLCPFIFRQVTPEGVLFVFALFIMSLWLIRDRTGYKLSVLSEKEKNIRFMAGMIAVHAFGATVFMYAIVLYLMHRSTQQIPLYQVLLLATHSWLSLYIFWSAFNLILQKTHAALKPL